MHVHHSALVDHFWRGVFGPQIDVSALRGKMTIEDAEAVQLSMLDRWLSQGESLAGWKVGLTSGAMRDAAGKGVRPFGFVLLNRLIKTDDEISLGAIRGCGIETELCFSMGQDLYGHDVTAEMARKSIQSVEPAFEINETRISGPADIPCRVADNLSQWGVVIGPMVSPLPPLFAYDEIEVALSRDGVEIERVVAGGRIDDHFESIAALARELTKFGRRLHGGERVITGSLTRHPVTAPGRWEAGVGALGRVAINFI